MRLGGYLFTAESVGELEALLPKLDDHGLSAIPAPVSIDDLSDSEAFEFGARARQYDLVVGESMLRANLMIGDPERREENIGRVRKRLDKADLMGCRCIFIGVGSVRQVDGFAALDPYMYTRECMKEYSGLVLRALDSVDVDGSTKLAIEPTNRSFFSDPDAMAELVTMVDHPRFAVHLDLANLISQQNYFESSSLIERAFSSLSSSIVSAHLKDIRWDPSYYSLKLDEVYVGDGVIDYPTYLRYLSAFDADFPCYCEHLETEAEYAVNFERLHALAAGIGHPFAPRHR